MSNLNIFTFTCIDFDTSDDNKKDNDTVCNNQTNILVLLDNSNVNDISYYNVNNDVDLNLLTKGKLLYTNNINILVIEYLNIIFCYNFINVYIPSMCNSMW